jgi:UDP-N-acetylmuramoylalanine--D-glutamate ligase
VRTLILGTNLRGLADAATISLEEGAEVTVYDSQRSDPPQNLIDRVTVLATEWTVDNLDGIDRVVTSPWFPPSDPPISDALSQGIDVITEAGFALEHTTAPFVAITGTNGKTTVTEVASAMLVASGVAAVAAGNVGESVSGIVGNKVDVDVLVLELSSYQLRFLGGAIPRAAALLNIAPDHLDWHGTFANYVAAKSRIFEGMADDSVLAYNAHDRVVVDAVAGATCALVPCSGVDLPSGGNGVTDGRVMINGYAFDAPTSDPTFLFDLVAAGTVAMAVGASTEGVGATIASFVPGAHRRHVIDTSDGIRWIDDSKATNPHATSAAVAAYQPVILLAGGQNKGLDLSSIGRLDGIETLIAFGEAGPLIGRAASVETIVVDSLGAAVAQARCVARPGDTVLLSPGCTSFDEFTSYAERGDEFHRLVKQMEGTPA